MSDSSLQASSDLQSAFVDLLRDEATGHPIIQFDSRGYLNATALAHYHGKTWGQVTRGQEWEEDIVMAMEEFGLTRAQIINLGTAGRVSTPVRIETYLY